jgi:hypothetical protein
MELRQVRAARLTDSNFLSTVKMLGREAAKKLWLAAAHFFSLPRLGGRTIGSTSDSDSDYPGSSPGLPAKLLSFRGIIAGRPMTVQAYPCLPFCSHSILGQWNLEEIPVGDCLRVREGIRSRSRSNILSDTAWIEAGHVNHNASGQRGGILCSANSGHRQGRK